MHGMTEILKTEVIIKIIKTIDGTDKMLQNSASQKNLIGFLKQVRVRVNGKLSLTVYYI